MRKKTVLLRGPVLTRSGYGEQARFALRSLRSREDLFDIYIHPINWGKTGWVWEESEFRVWMDERITDTQIKSQNNLIEIYQESIYRQNYLNNLLHLI